MTKLDQNDIVESAFLCVLIEALGSLGLLVGTLFYLGLSLVALFCGFLLIGSSISDLLNALFT
jgi:uncharacterized membrane protein YciS (DUF1049 family)